MTQTVAGHPAVVRMGARSPLGLNAPQVAMCWRAGNFEPRRAPLVDKRDQPVGMGRARFLPDDLYGIDRCVALGSPALREAGCGLGQPVPLVLCVSEPGRPDDDARFDGPIIRELATQSDVAVDMTDSVVVRQGHAGFAHALDHALRLLSAGTPAAVVGAIDSYYHPEVVAWLDQGCRLHGPGTEDGIIPSEGAAFVLLTRGALDNASSERLFGSEPPSTEATVRHAAAARDELALDPEQPLLATVMTDLVAGATRAVGGSLPWVLSDVSTEFHRIREWSRVEIRHRLAMLDEKLQRLPDQMGECGAATGALGLVIACALWQAQCAPADRALFALHSEGAERGVFVAQALRPQRQPVPPAAGGERS